MAVVRSATKRVFPLQRGSKSVMMISACGYIRCLIGHPHLLPGRAYIFTRFITFSRFYSCSGPRRRSRCCTFEALAWSPGHRMDVHQRLVHRYRLFKCSDFAIRHKYKFPARGPSRAGSKTGSRLVWCPPRGPVVAVTSGAMIQRHLIPRSEHMAQPPSSEKTLSSPVF